MSEGIDGPASISRLVDDVTELVWNTYGVFSRPGQRANVAYQCAGQIAVLLGDQPHGPPDDNRFVFERVPYQKRQPRAMTREQHAHVGRELRAARQYTAQRLITERPRPGEQSEIDRFGLWTALDRTIALLIGELEACAREEHPDLEALGFYCAARA